MGSFYDIDQIIDANKSTGRHFFDRDTMRYFRGRVTSNVYPLPDGALFVHSIHNPELGPRQYRVAWAHSDGATDSVDDDRKFGRLELSGFATLAQAKNYAAQLQLELTANPPLAWTPCANAGHAGPLTHGASCYRCCACLSCSIARRDA